MRPQSCTLFSGSARIASGPLLDMALAARTAQELDAAAALLVFDDATGQAIDLDLRGSPQDVARRLDDRFGAEVQPADEAPKRGRPKLGVIPREVTLLPRHWDWLATQPGGASVALRKLVEEARRTDEGPARARAAQQAAYRFMSAMAGDEPGFEEATRALFAGAVERFEAETQGWPADLRDHARQLAAAAFA